MGVGAEQATRAEEVTKLKFWSKTQALADAARITGLMKDPKLILEVNPLVELMQRISGNGSGLPYNGGPSPTYNALRGGT